jgi:hypothetical protein
MQDNIAIVANPGKSLDMLYYLRHENVNSTANRTFHMNVCSVLVWWEHNKCTSEVVIAVSNLLQLSVGPRSSVGLRAVGCITLPQDPSQSAHGPFEGTLLQLHTKFITFTKLFLWYFSMINTNLSTSISLRGHCIPKPFVHIPQHCTTNWVIRNMSRI